ncbi:hypothetical protein [Deinococcus sp. RIT780]|uniref:hypothetical protein n=1 Tax=Deinococcus sp. RIT780 TaxID=2870472 RepID=UPI001C896E6D|nr:hypothetical protein [Deinococcus sp. RIT780]MBX8463523.1 hypothetical protein [Deinococcus sp. RIT780]
MNGRMTNIDKSGGPLRTDDLRSSGAGAAAHFDPVTHLDPATVINLDGASACVNVTMLTSRGGYRPVGLGWSRPFGFRVHCWDRPGVGRVGLFLPAGVSGQLPSRVQLRGDLGRLGSGVLVPGLRAVLLSFEAFPVNGWFDVVIP